MTQLIRRGPSGWQIRYAWKWRSLREIAEDQGAKHDTLLRRILRNEKYSRIINRPPSAHLFDTAQYIRTSHEWLRILEVGKKNKYFVFYRGAWMDTQALADVLGCGYRCINTRCWSATKRPQYRFDSMIRPGQSKPEANIDAAAEERLKAAEQFLSRARL